MNLRPLSSKVAIIFSGLALAGGMVCAVATTPDAQAKGNGNGHGHGHGHHGKGHGHGHGHHNHPLAVDGSFGVVSMGPPSWVSQETPDLCVLWLPATFGFTGDFDGSFTDCEFYIEHYGPCDQPAPEYFASEGVWTGAVLGGEGSFAFSFEGEIDAQGSAQGDLTIDGGSCSGELEGLGGTITLDGVTGVGGSYSGEVDFD